MGVRVPGSLNVIVSASGATVRRNNVDPVVALGPALSHQCPFIPSALRRMAKVTIVRAASGLEPPTLLKAYS